jgi:hypothetical protein
MHMTLTEVSKGLPDVEIIVCKKATVELGATEKVQ